MFCRGPESVSIKGGQLEATARRKTEFNTPAAGFRNALAGRQIGKAALDVGDDLQRAIELLALVGRHQARPKKGAARRHGGVERDVGVDAGVKERLPEQD